MPDYNRITPYVRNALDLNRVANGIAEDAQKLYVDAAQDILRQFADTTGKTEDKMAWLNAQAGQIRDTLATANNKAYGQVIGDLTKVLKQQTKFHTDQLKKDTKGADVNVRTVQVGRSYVEALAEGKAEIDVKAKADTIKRTLPRILPDEEKPLKQIWGNLLNNNYDNLTKGIRSGLLLGKTTDQIVKDLLQGNRIPKGSPLKKSERALRATVQSAVIGVSAEAQLNAIAANTDITEKYEFLATLDSRTTILCASNDSKVFRYDDTSAPRPPLHYRCRSTIISYLGDFYKKYGIDPPESSRASVNGQVDRDENYESWLRKQPEDYQNEALGKGRADLFRKGVGLAQMVREDGTTKPLQETTQSPSPPAEEDNIFPQDLSQLKVVKSLGGSTGAELVVDPATGRQFVRKTGASANHIREEFYADRAYEALGVPVPKGKLYDDGGQPVKLTEYIKGKPLGAFSGKELEQIKKKLQANFAADALLGNWDVIGMAKDNILVTPDGIPYRIDNGGALRFRAQGDKKGKGWNNYPVELFTLRDKNRNAITGDIYGDIELPDLIRQVQSIETSRNALLKSLPRNLQRSMSERLNEATRLMGIAQTLLDDSYTPAYADKFIKHSLNLRAQGIVGKLPNELLLGANNTFVDDQGKAFDNFRGPGSLVEDLADYMNSFNGDYNAVSTWQRRQGGSSWSNESISLKHLMAKSRTVSDDAYFWKGEKLKTREKLFKAQSKSYSNYEETMIAYHAFNYELLSKTKFPNNNQSNNTVRIYRTESYNTMRTRNGFDVGDANLQMKRGAAESASIFTPVRASAGGELTIQEVPYHRILGNYFLSRGPGSTHVDAFLGDKENEFIFLPEGIKFDYVTGDTQDFSRFAAKPQIADKIIAGQSYKPGANGALKKNDAPPSTTEIKPKESTIDPPATYWLTYKNLKDQEDGIEKYQELMQIAGQDMEQIFNNFGQDAFEVANYYDQFMALDPKDWGKLKP